MQKCSDMAHDSKGITQFYLPPTHETYLPLLPSRRASPPFGWYSLRLPTEGWPGWVDLGDWLYTEIDCDCHQSSYCCKPVFICWPADQCLYTQSHVFRVHCTNKAHIGIRLRPGITTPLPVVGQRFNLTRFTIWPTTAKRNVIHKTKVHSVSQRCQKRTEPTGDLHKKFCEGWSSGSRGMPADRQTHTHADRQTNWSQYTVPLPGWSN